MKTKNTRLRIKDLYHGLVVYMAHPVYGIEVKKIIGKPKVRLTPGSLFVDYIDVGHNHTVHRTSLDYFSLSDAGITTGESYNFRRSFRKIKHAEEWCEKMKTCERFLIHQANHEEICRNWF